MMRTLLEQFGPIDIYLFDQILRGRITPEMRVLDVGCGAGRNLIYLLQAGAEVFGVDADAEALGGVRSLAAHLAPALPETNFRLERIEGMSFPDRFADVVLSSAVLHFAADDAHFRRMLEHTWRVLKPGGLFFCRLASNIGTEPVRLSGRRFLLQDGSERYLVDERQLMDLTETLGGEMLDPLKTTVVQGQRSMTTWVLRKRAGRSNA